jgi:outer membrane protein insertion porin family
MFKKLLNILTIIFLFTGYVCAETFLDFKITGNDRVSKQTIINFSKLKKNIDVTNDDLNNALKDLYDTNFFEEISINIENNVLSINVKEYPFIQDIEFNGIKAKKFVKLIEQQTLLKAKNPFNKFILQKDSVIVTNILRKLGFYFSKVEVQQKKNPNNTVNIIYDITLGEKAMIKEIKFIGDKKFKSSKLLAVINSEEEKFWKFLSKKKFLDKERTTLDKRLLRNFYLNKGYYNAKIEDVYTQVLDGKDFSLTFKIDSGKKFFFNTFEIKIPDDYNIKDFQELQKLFKSLENSAYSYGSIESILDEIDVIAAIKNYEFIDIKVDEIIEDDNKINFVFNIKEGNKFYVERINILGNNITNEAFIRQQIVVDEGDPFNSILHNKTINNLKSSRLFRSVVSDIKDGSAKGLKIINLTVEDQPTGEISAGAGYGSNGSSFSIGIKENNFNGNGIKLDANLALTENSIRGKFSYTNPYFSYSDRAVTASLESTSTDKEKDYGFKSSLNRISLGTGFEQFTNFYLKPQFSISNEVLTTTENASVNYKKQQGSYFDALLNYSMTYDNRNSSYKPSSGLVSTFLQEVPVISNGSSIVNGYQITGYKEIMEDTVLSVGLYTRAITSLKSNTDVRVSKRLFLPASKLRGFKSGKVGPKDGFDYVGGNYMGSLNASLSLPFLFPSLDKVDFALFFDVANVWHVDYSQNVDQGNTVRSSTGVALDIITPMGPLSFSLTHPITKDQNDVTEGFRFNLGTTF